MKSTCNELIASSKWPPLDQADCAVFPVSWERVWDLDPARRLANDLAIKAKNAGKRTLIFRWDDSTEKIPVDNAVVLRTSLERSTRAGNEFAMPAWSEDFVVNYLDGELPVRRKSERPKIGFCGAVLSPGQVVRKRLRAGLRQLVHASGLRKAKGSPTNLTGHMLRAQALDHLEKSPVVDTSFIIRRNFWGGATLSHGQDLARMRVLRREYLANIVDTDYTLCVRGAGNFSYRLYETLSCGRIPVFVDTDCVLPYEFCVDWNDYVVRVDSTELSQIGEKVAAFHNAMTPEEYVACQHRCRELWEEKLSPEGFFSEMWRHVQGNVVIR